MGFLDNVFKRGTFFDNRKARRLESPMLVAYYWDGATPNAHQIRNISSQGFYLLTDEQMRPGTVITMTLQKTATQSGESGAKPHLNVMSMVIRQGEDGIGFAFLPQEPKDSDQEQSSGNKPAGRKAIGRFLEEINSEEGHMNLSLKADTPKPTPSLQNALPATPGASSPKRRFNDESGQALIFAALATTCLFGFVALATDVGIMMRAKRQAQTAADAAAIAGALEYNFLGSSATTAIKAAGQAASAQNGFTNGSNGVTVTINPPPLYGPHAGVNGYVEAIVSVQQPTLFMGMFGIASLTPTARAVATNGGGAANGCVYILSPNASDAMELQGSFTVSAPNCGIIVDSNATGALDFTGAGGSLSAGSVGVVGTCTGHCSDSTPAPVAGIIPQSDPLGNLTLPDPTTPPLSTSCAVPNAGTKNAGTLTGTVSASGVVCYSGNVTLSNVTLNGGTYVFTGNVTLDSNVTTSGATLDINSGTLSINTGTTLNLLAPTSGTYNGIALMQPLANTNQITIQKGDASGTVDGIIYAPGAELFLQDSGGDESGGLTLITDLIVGTLFDKTATLTIQSYSQTNPTTTPLSRIALVE
jgi:Putative Flp pilus-assembly TadE/G-like